MRDVCPEPYNSYACSSVISAWSGGAFDEKRNRMVIYGGGHGDSWYNNIFTFDVVAMKWERQSEMPIGAASAPPTGWRDYRLDTCGFYPKGAVTLPDSVLKNGYVDPAKCFEEPVLSQLDLQQPRSSHTYGTFFVDRVQDRYCSISAAFYPNAQASSPTIPCFDPNTKKWTRMADRPARVGGMGQTALDSNGNVWSISAGSGLIGRYDPTTNAWTTFGLNNYDGGGGTDVDRKRNQLYSYEPSTGLRRWNLLSSSSLLANKTYADVVATGDTPTGVGTRPGFTYADASDRFYAWGGGRDVYTFDPATSTWKRFTANGDDPGAQQKWGTYGRFRHVPSRNVFVLINDISQDVYIYKPAS